MGDFAILLRAGFTRFEAVKLQLLTACGGIIGAITAFLVESVQSAGIIFGVLPAISIHWNDRRSPRVFLCFYSAIFKLTSGKF